MLQVRLSFMQLEDYWNKYSKNNNVTSSRLHENVIHRHAFCHAVRENARMSLQKIGKIIGRDHATVIWGCKNHEMNYRFDSDYRIVYDNINQEIQHMLLENGVVPKTIADGNDVRDVHFKFLDLSKRLRRSINTVNSYKMEIKKVEVYKRHIAELETKNQKLNKELSRLKNLL